MARGKKHTAEEIVNRLRQFAVGLANSKTLPQAFKEPEIVEQTDLRWAPGVRWVEGGSGSAAEGSGA